MKYTNPRLTATIPDWPSGHRRVTAHFSVETNGAKQRAVRQTEDPFRGKAEAKKRTYANAVRIVDGEDGHTYILENHGSHITAIQGMMKYETETFWNPEFFPQPQEDKDAFNEVVRLFAD